MSAENLKRSFFYQALKATAIAVLLCIFSAALFAVLARFVTLSATAVKISGIAAKIFSLFIAALVSFRDGICSIPSPTSGSTPRTVWL